MKKTFSPLRYPGGKSQLYDGVLRIMEINKIRNPIYIEPFAGGAGVAIRLLIENKVSKIILNDFDRAIYSFWNVIKNNSESLIRKIKTTEITLEERLIQKEIYKNPNNHTEEELAFAALFLNRVNRSGILTAGVIGGNDQSGNYKMDCRFNKEAIIEKIEAIAKLKDKIEVACLDAKEFILKYKDAENAFWFMDPPYFVKGADLYKEAFKKIDHLTFRNCVRCNLQNAKWLLTYDDCEDIRELFAEFNMTNISLQYSVLNKRKEGELLFYNNLKVEED